MSISSENTSKIFKVSSCLKQNVNCQIVISKCQREREKLSHYFCKLLRARNTKIKIRRFSSLTLKINLDQKEVMHVILNITDI